MNLFKRITRAVRRDDGAVAVEFVILLPLMMATFAFIVETSRIYWNYQSAVSGVRDAARYIARTYNADFCDGGAAFDQVTAEAQAELIIRNTMRDEAGLFPSGVTLDDVRADDDCVSTPTLRVAQTPIVTVEADVTVEMPFGILFQFFGDVTDEMETTITDQSRVYGI